MEAFSSKSVYRTAAFRPVRNTEHAVLLGRVTYPVRLEEFLVYFSFFGMTKLISFERKQLLVDLFIFLPEATLTLYRFFAPIIISLLLSIYPSTQVLASFIEQFLHGDKILEHNFRLVILSAKEPDAWYVGGGREEGGRLLLNCVCVCGRSLEGSLERSDFYVSVFAYLSVCVSAPGSSQPTLSYVARGGGATPYYHPISLAEEGAQSKLSGFHRYRGCL